MPPRKPKRPQPTTKTKRAQKKRPITGAVRAATHVPATVTRTARPARTVTPATRAATRAPAAEPPTPAAEPPADPRATANAEALVARVFELDRKIKSDFYAIGLVLRDLAKPESYRALRCRTFDELLRKRKLPKRAMAYRLIEVVNKLDSETAHVLGVERAYHAVKYAEAFAPRTRPKDFVRPDRRLRILDTTYVLATISTRPLRDAVLARRTGARLTPPPALEPTTRGLAQRLHHRGIDATRVTSHYRAGTAEVTIRLPLEAAKKLFDRLA